MVLLYYLWGFSSSHDERKSTDVEPRLPRPIIDIYSRFSRASGEVFLIRRDLFFLPTLLLISGCRCRYRGTQFIPIVVGPPEALQVSITNSRICVRLGECPSFSRLRIQSMKSRSCPIERRRCCCRAWVYERPPHNRRVNVSRLTR